MIEYKRYIRHSILAGLLVAGSSPALASDDDLLNERFFEPGSAIEVHWQIDCGNTSAAVSALLEQLAEARQANCAATLQQVELSNLLDSLQKCGFIYNIKGSRRFQSCPDYALAQRGLKRTTAACRNDPEKFASRLSAVRQAHAALNCKEEN